MRATDTYNASNGLTAKANYAAVRGLVINNNSSLYVLVRIGANDAPSTAGSADYIVPPYSYFTAPSYNGNFGFLWTTQPASSGATSTAAGLLPGSTRAGGVTTISYSDAQLAYSLSPLPSTLVQAGQFTIFTRTDSNAATGYHKIMGATTVPLYLSYAFVRNQALIAGSATVTLLVAVTADQSDQHYLNSVSVDSTLSRSPFDCSFGPMPTEQAYQIPVGYSLWYNTTGNLLTTNVLANYYQ